MKKRSNNISQRYKNIRIQLRKSKTHLVMHVKKMMTFILSCNQQLFD